MYKSAKLPTSNKWLETNDCGVNSWPKQLISWFSGQSQRPRNCNATPSRLSAARSVPGSGHHNNWTQLLSRLRLLCGFSLLSPRLWKMLSKLKFEVSKRVCFHTPRRSCGCCNECPKPAWHGQLAGKRKSVWRKLFLMEILDTLAASSEFKVCYVHWLKTKI